MWKGRRKEGGPLQLVLFFAQRRLHWRRPYLARLAFGGLGRSTFSFGRQTVLARSAVGRSVGRTEGKGKRKSKEGGEREKRGHPSPRPKRARKTNGCNRTELMWWKEGANSSPIGSESGSFDSEGGRNESFRLGTLSGAPSEKNQPRRNTAYVHKFGVFS